MRGFASVVACLAVAVALPASASAEISKAVAENFCVPPDFHPSRALTSGRIDYGPVQTNVLMSLTLGIVVTQVADAAKPSGLAGGGCDLSDWVYTAK